MVKAEQCGLKANVSSLWSCRLAQAYQGLQSADRPGLRSQLWDLAAVGPASSYVVVAKPSKRERFCCWLNQCCTAWLCILYLVNDTLLWLVKHFLIQGPIYPPHQSFGGARRVFVRKEGRRVEPQHRLPSPTRVGLSSALVDKPRTTAVQGRVLTPLQPRPDPMGANICGCSSPLCKMALYLHAAYPHPTVYGKSCPDYL